MSNPWIFMGVDRSHFSAKLRPAVRYKQIHCVEYPPNMQQIQDRTGVGFVPVLISPEDETFQDTTDIIDMLEQRVPSPPLIPTHPVDLAVSRLIEVYADEFFPMVSMRTRWAYEENNKELRRAFAAFSFSEEQGNNVANLMSSYLPMLGVTEASIPAIDAHTTEMLKLLDAHLARHPFLLGNRISLADCALMGPLYAHLFLDRVTRKQLLDDAIHVCMWIERCNRPVPETMQDWFESDYPETLQSILSLIGTDAVPLLRDHAQAFATWRNSNPDEKDLPRIVGTYDTSFRNVAVSPGIRCYVSWKIQRLQEAAADAQVKSVFSNCGCDDLLDLTLPSLKKQDFELAFA